MSSGGASLSKDSVLFDKKCIALILLVIVNVLWVLSSELTRFIFVDEDFKRPFFTVYLKSCTLVFYMIRYLSCESPEENSYSVLISESSDTESYELTCESLSVEGFESVTEDSDVESCPDDSVSRKRRVQFSNRKEVRRMPASNAEDQRRARLPYRNPALECHFTIPRHFKYTVFIFAPLWLVCSFTFQAALVYTSVSTLNLISSSSSVFILAFTICFPNPNNKFTLYKAILVAMNIAGVMLVSHVSPSLLGAFFAQISAVSYAVYLTAYSHYEDKYGKISINLLFGSIGVIALVIGTPMLNILDKFGLEPLYPLPNAVQLTSILLSALFGTLVADYLYMLAASMCDSLTSSLALTLSIPFSFAADTLLRSRPPSAAQLIAAIPITLSFVGAAFAQRSPSSSRLQFFRHSVSTRNDDDSEMLIEENEQ